MYIAKFTLSYTRTINLGDFNNIKISIMPTVHVEPGEDLDEILREVWKMCRANVQHAARPIAEGYKVGDKHGVTSEELFLGLPVELQEQIVRSIEDAD